ncbi:glycosyltransferase family 4 protein [Pseudonocardia kunmingensis]|uniref:Glycosyltransferase involved in cell wall biosynthesis n=1 Tax=Pseudonocardia kunmingensis TaxID=630975 RepID=A0A543D9X1_9PSEU|nr:glycosyltransferase family 4 protein [Pseudonocardia kunmingensis]TQM06129.1 glycosyltransferase involved in cell wall biosynthesis [Pseudonocardia kunmingensis]
MRLTLIGPAFPWRGGIPLLTTELAHRLAADGHHVRVRTWTRQGPARLLPAQRHPLTAPEARPFPTVDEPLSWRNPLDWVRTGRRAGAESDLVVLVFYTTVQAPALTVIARLARRRARVVVICANAVPHEPRPGDRVLLARLVRGADAAVTHTDAERAALCRLTDRPVAVAPLPPHLPDTDRPELRPDRPALHRLLFFGKVRPYKGVDVLLEALREVPGVTLSIVGEFYEDVARTRATVRALGLADRVELHPDYLPADRIPALFARFDALVLPYRTATASQLVALAHWNGLPVVATRVGNFPETVRDGVDGLLCTPGDAGDLARALRALHEPGRLERLRTGVRPAATEGVWQRYTETLFRLAARPPHEAAR